MKSLRGIARVLAARCISRRRVEGDADRALGAAAQRAVRKAAPMGGRVSIVAG
jgi:hypothetical protein